MRSRTFAAAAALGLTVFACVARAQSDTSAVSALSALPVASVIGAAGAAGSVASSAIAAVPVALSVAGILVVRTVEASARGTVYVLERVSDGSRVSVQVAAAVAANASLAAGTVVAVSVISAGAVLSVAGQVIAFIPNALGRALLYDERLTW